MKKRIMATLLAALMTFTMVGCGETNDDPIGRPQGTVIKIYTGGSSEFSWPAGSREDEIIDYIEQKYYDEMHVSLDFQVSRLGSEDFWTKISASSAGGDSVDIAVSHTRGGVGIDDRLVQNQSFLGDITEDLSDYGENVIEAFSHSLIENSISTPLDAITTDDDKIIGIPSVVNPYKFGILVRKDRMEAVGYTDDAEKANTLCEATGKNYILVDNLEDFTAMCKAIKTEYNSEYVVSGAIWDLEKSLTLGAFGNAGQYTNAAYPNEGEGTIRVGSSNDYYLHVLNQEYEWARDGVISKDGSVNLQEKGEEAFVGGKSSVFVLDPTVKHLIEVSRKCKANPDNADAEFTVLGALREKRNPDECKYKDENGQPLKGFMRNTEAVFCAAILKTSKNTSKIIKFLNWVYKNKDNYELCRYGRKGTDWIDNGDGTYSYPEGLDITNPPYSGILSLVENQYMSDLIYAGYTAEERSWIENAKNPDNYVENDVIDYLLPDNATLYADISTEKNSLTSYFDNVWNGKNDPMKDNGAQFKQLARALREKSQTGNYGKGRYKKYLDMKQKRIARITEENE